MSPSRVREDAGATELTVTASLVQEKTFPSDVEISLSLADGTATLAGGDYTAATGTVTIPAGQLYGISNFTFTPTNDAVVESDETVLLTASLEGINVFPATVTIINTSHGDLSISGPASNVAEGSDATFVVTLSAGVSKAVSVAWSAPLSSDGAVATDLGTTSGTVTFAANSAAGATQSITITATDDMLSEGAESFTVTLGAITSTLSSQISKKERGGFRDGDDFCERCDHGEHQRAD